jgi:hypothetical protein
MLALSCFLHAWGATAVQLDLASMQKQSKYTFPSRGTWRIIRGKRALSKGEGQGTYVYAEMNSLVLIRPIPTTFLNLILQTTEHNFGVDILHSRNFSICCNHGSPSAHPIFFSISH